MNTLQINDFESVTKIEIRNNGGLDIMQKLLDIDANYESIYLENDEVKALYLFLKDYYETNCNHKNR